MTIADIPTRTADTSTPLLNVLATRWSPRSFDETAAVDEQKLTAALEAARWSPSASNSQPWRFVVARRGTAEFETVKASLMGFNQAWAGSAGVLIVAFAETVDANGKALPWAAYDLGQSIAHLSVQAHHDGLHAHQMGGFDAVGLRASFGIDERFVATSVTALGVLGEPDALPEVLREREVAKRERVALDDLLFVNA